MTDKEDGHEVAVRTSVAVLAAGASLLGPDAAAVATALTPAMEALVSRMVGVLSQWRVRHAAETLEYAAEAAGEPVGQLVEKAVADERREELLSRTLTIAQDTALRDKRRALGRALAAGIAGDDAKIDDELLFIRAVADIDTSHIRLLSLMASEAPPPPRNAGAPQGWSAETIAERDPGLSEAIPALLSTLESHALVHPEDRLATYGGMMTPQVYNVTNAGRVLLERLAAEGTK
jgi:hypothetical protein